MAEWKKLLYEEKLQAVVHCIEHQLDYSQTSEQYENHDRAAQVNPTVHRCSIVTEAYLYQ